MLVRLLRQTLSSSRPLGPLARRGRRYTGGQIRSDHQTHLTGLYRDERASEKLAALYRETLTALAALPADYYYRQSLEGTLKDRLSLLEGSSDRARAEAAIGEGLLEEVMEQARAELDLVQTMVREGWNPWEPLVEGPITED